MKANGTYLSYNNPQTSITAYKAYFGAISTVLNTALTRSGDTGQVVFANLTTVVATYGRDYEVFALTDTLQATKPIYLRIDYWSPSTSNVGMMMATVGTTTDGAGNLGGVTSHNQYLINLTTGTSVLSRNCYVSTDGSYIMIALNMQAAAVTATSDSLGAIIVERTRDGDGTPNGNGYMVYRWTQQGDSGSVGTSTFTGAMSRTYDTTAYQPPTTFDLGILAPQMGSTTTFVQGGTATGFPVYGWTPANGTQGASKALMVCGYNDFPQKSVASLTHYGTATQWLPLGLSQPAQVAAMTSINNASFRSGNLGLLLRWE